MITIHVLLLILAFVCFFLDAIGVPATPIRVKLTPLGLAFWVLSILLTGVIR